MPTAKLDTLVTIHMNERLFQPEPLAMILSQLSSRHSDRADAVNGRVTALQREAPRAGQIGFIAIHPDRPDAA